MRLPTLLMFVILSTCTSVNAELYGSPLQKKIYSRCYELHEYIQSYGASSQYVDELVYYLEVHASYLFDLTVMYTYIANSSPFLQNDDEDEKIKRLTEYFEQTLPYAIDRIEIIINKIKNIVDSEELPKTLTEYCAKKIVEIEELYHEERNSLSFLYQ